MEEYTQITLTQWMEWKEDIRKKLAETAGNFVHIGYRLKQIRDSGMLDGAADIFEFAQKEYGLNKSTVSRFIAINEKFSEGGDSLELKKEYKALGSSKLAEMLTLPDAECSMITEAATVKQIRELKQFTRKAPDMAAGEEENTPAAAVEKANPIEENQGSEPVATSQQEENHYTPLQKCIIDFFRSRKALLNEVIPLIYDMNPGVQEQTKKIVDLINPSGSMTHKKGLVFLFMYDDKTGIKYKMLTASSPVEMSWNDFLEDIFDIYKATYCGEGEEDVHRAFYGDTEQEPVPEAPKKEPAKQEKTPPAAGKKEPVAAGVEKAGPIEENQGSEPVATSQQEEDEKEEGDGKDNDEYSGEDGDQNEGVEDGAGEDQQEGGTVGKDAGILPGSSYEEKNRERIEAMKELEEEIGEQLIWMRTGLPTIEARHMTLYEREQLQKNAKALADAIKYYNDMREEEEDE